MHSNKPMSTPSPELPPTRSLAAGASLPAEGATLPCAPSDGGSSSPIPQRFGDYEIESELARGGMGVVYKARQLTLNRPVALKMILLGRLADPIATQRFRVEAEAAAALDHPHIVPIYDVGSVDGQVYFSMKLIEGETLAEKLKATPVQDRTGEVLRCFIGIFLQVVEAVAFAHQRGVIHRDLKPSNILLDKGATPVIADFGLAKRQADALGGKSVEEITHTGAVIGTPHYMAPEQAKDAKETTTQTDVYSLGAILFEMLTGRPPIVGANYIETLIKVQDGEVPLPSSINPKVDAGLAAIALKCLKKTPKDRYASAAHLASDLRSWLAGEPLSVKPAGLLESIRFWIHRHLQDAFWVVFIGVVPGGLGILLEANTQGFANLFSEMVTAYQRFHDLKPPDGFVFAAWISSWFQGAAGSWIAIGLAYFLTTGLGFFLSLIIRLPNYRHAMKSGVGLGLAVGMIGFSTLAPSFLLALVYVRSMSEQGQLIHHYFEVPHPGSASLLDLYPELSRLNPEDRVAYYQALTGTRQIIGIFKGVWFGMAYCLLYWPLMGVIQVSLASFLQNGRLPLIKQMLVYFLIMLPLHLGMHTFANLVLQWMEWRWHISILALLPLLIQLVIHCGLAWAFIHAVQRQRPLIHYVFLMGAWFNAYMMCLLLEGKDPFKFYFLLGPSHFVVLASTYSSMFIMLVLVLWKHWREPQKAAM